MTVRDVVAVLCVTLLLVGCGRQESGPDPMTRYTLIHDGLEREYFVFLPSDYHDSRDSPLVIFMHGYGGTATGTEAEVTQGLNFYAEKAGYVAVYPQSTWFMADPGTDEQWEVTSWNHISDGFDRGPSGPICESKVPQTLCPPECGDCGNCGWASCNDDVGFLRALVAEMHATHAIDDVFVSGFSNGAMMANRVACEASELFSGAMLVGGRVEKGFECTPTKPLPLLQVNGGADATVPADGSVSRRGYHYSDTRSIAHHWQDGAACAAKRASWTSPAVEDTTAECTIACPDSAAVSVDCLWPEGNHRWPGTDDFRGSNGYCVTELQSASMPDQLICIDPDPDTNFWGSTLMFEFFDTHRSSR
ncbi:MAG: hypothetical protein AAFN50_11570 [Pseudomonadota bacterium]